MDKTLTALQLNMSKTMYEILSRVIKEEPYNTKGAYIRSLLKAEVDEYLEKLKASTRGLISRKEALDIIKNIDPVDALKVFGAFGDPDWESWLELDLESGKVVRRDLWSGDGDPGRGNAIHLKGLEPIEFEVGVNSVESYEYMNLVRELKEWGYSELLYEFEEWFYKHSWDNEEEAEIAIKSLVEDLGLPRDFAEDLIIEDKDQWYEWWEEEMNLKADMEDIKRQLDRVYGKEHWLNDYYYSRQDYYDYSGDDRELFGEMQEKMRRIELGE